MDFFRFFYCGNEVSFLKDKFAGLMVGINSDWLPDTPLGQPLHCHTCHLAPTLCIDQLSNLLNWCKTFNLVYWAEKNQDQAKTNKSLLAAKKIFKNKYLLQKLIFLPYLSHCPSITLQITYRWLGIRFMIYLIFFPISLISHQMSVPWSMNRWIQLSAKLKVTVLLNSDPEKKNFYIQNQSQRVSVTIVHWYLIILKCFPWKFLR